MAIILKLSSFNFFWTLTLGSESLINFLLDPASFKWSSTHCLIGLVFLPSVNSVILSKSLVYNLPSLAGKLPKAPSNCRRLFWKPLPISKTIVLTLGCLSANLNDAKHPATPAPIIPTS